MSYQYKDSWSATATYRPSNDSDNIQKEKPALSLTNYPALLTQYNILSLSSADMSSVDLTGKNSGYTSVNAAAAITSSWMPAMPASIASAGKAP